MKKQQGPKVLVLDIETSLMHFYGFSLGQQYVGTPQIKKDWHLMSFAAKWLDDPNNKVIYMDQSRQKDITNDKKLCEAAWALLDEADIVLTQNGKRFDVKKLYARFIINKLDKPSSFRQLDTYQIGTKYFGFTSHKLQYMTDMLCKKYKKASHSKYPGISLWIACEEGKKDAWKHMKDYNIMDVLSTEELYNLMKSWDNSIDFNVYSDNTNTVCKCGSKTFAKNGFFHSNSGKYQRFKCKECGHETRSKENLLSKEKRNSIRPGT